MLGGTTTAKCSYCKETFNTEVLRLHEKRCTDKPMKCPECSEVILLLNWYEHKCQTPKTEGTFFF